DMAAAQGKDDIDAFRPERLGNEVPTGYYAGVLALLLQGVFCGRRLRCRLSRHGQPPCAKLSFPSRLVELHEALDMIPEPQRVLAHQSLGKLGFARLQRVDDFGVIDDRAFRPVELKYRALSDRAHVHEQAVTDLGDQRALAEADDRLMELDVG